MNNFSSIHNKISQAKELDFGDILNKCLQLFKKTWLQGFLFFVILLIIMLPVFSIIFIPMYMSLMEQIQNGGLDPNATGNWLSYQSFSFRFMIIGLTGLLSLITVPITAGFYGIIRKIDQSQPHDFKGFFQFFKKEYVLKIISIAAFSMLIGLLNYGLENVLPNILASLINAGFSGLLSVYSMLLVVFLAYSPELDVTEIFKSSFNLGIKKLLLILGLLIVTGIIGFLGIIACFVGVLFTISIVYLPVYFIYKEVIGFNEVSDIDKIGTE